MFDRTLLTLSLRVPHAAQLVLRPAVVRGTAHAALAVKSIEADLSPTDLEMFRRLNPDPRPGDGVLRRGVPVGSAGVVDDYRVLATPWGFEPEQIEFPVRFWHGDDDRIVVISEARAVACRMPHATFTTFPGEGHMLLMAHFNEVLDTLGP